ncbi:MAG: endonuclease/exonuclease/phosphatase family protein [Bacteroidales bacterium]|nr:endonuclease/exonuclease/phosphatase family protein [Bacteroidales bacterium]
MGGKPKRKKHSSFRYKFLVLLNVVAALLLLISYISCYVSPDVLWPFAFFGLAYPLLVVINILFLLYWIIRRRWILFLPLLSITVGWNHLEAHFKPFSKSTLDPEKKHIKVMSFNAMFFDRYMQIQRDNLATLYDIYDLIESESPDILCIQEFYTDNTPDFNTQQTLATRCGYTDLHTNYMLVKRNGKSYGSAIFSRYPILNRGTIAFDNSPYYTGIFCDVVNSLDTLRVINVHFESLRLSSEDRIYINDLSRQEGPLLNLTSRKILNKLKSAYIKRAPQARIVNTAIHESPYPVILCADVNDTPTSYTYRLLTSELNDAFRESGKGFGKTYAGFYPPFRIDYILYHSMFESRDYRAIRKNLSDHYPIVTWLQY